MKFFKAFGELVAGLIVFVILVLAALAFTGCTVETASNNTRTVPERRVIVEHDRPVIYREIHPRR